jgi:hypothetical protein
MAEELEDIPRSGFRLVRPAKGGSGSAADLSVGDVYRAPVPACEVTQLGTVAPQTWPINIPAVCFGIEAADAVPSYGAVYNQAGSYDDWAQDTDYSEDDVKVGPDGINYVCLENHHSAPDAVFATDLAAGKWQSAAFTAVTGKTSDNFATYFYLEVAEGSPDLAAAPASLTKVSGSGPDTLGYSQFTKYTSPDVNGPLMLATGYDFTWVINAAAVVEYSTWHVLLKKPYTDPGTNITYRWANLNIGRTRTTDPGYDPSYTDYFVEVNIATDHGYISPLPDDQVPQDWQGNGHHYVAETIVNAADYDNQPYVALVDHDSATQFQADLFADPPKWDSAVTRDGPLFRRDSLTPGYGGSIYQSRRWANAFPIKATNIPHQSIDADQGAGFQLGPSPMSPAILFGSVTLSVGPGNFMTWANWQHDVDGRGHVLTVDGVIVEELEVDDPGNPGTPLKITNQGGTPYINGVPLNVP